MWTCPGWRQGGLGLRHSWPTSEGNLPSCGQSGPGWLPNIPVINIYTVGPLSLIWGWSHHSLLFRLQEMQRAELSSSHQHSGQSWESFLNNKGDYFRKNPNLFYFLSWDSVWLFSRCHCWYLWWLSSAISSWSLLIFRRTSVTRQGMFLNSQTKLKFDSTINNENLKF